MPVYVDSGTGELAMPIAVTMTNPFPKTVNYCSIDLRWEFSKQLRPEFDCSPGGRLTNCM